MTTFRYKYTGAQPVHFPSLGIEVNPGYTFEADLVGQQHALGERALEGKKGCVDLMGVEVNLRAGQRTR
jgi:hypothetical protein